MRDCADASNGCRLRHLHPVRRRWPHLRDRVVAAARARLREHDPGRLGHPHRVLRWHGHRGGRRRSDRRPGPLAAADVRRARAAPGRGRAGHAAVVPPHPRGLSRRLSGHRGDAVPRPDPPRAGRPRARAGDGHDGRHVPGARAPHRPDAGVERGVRAALRGQHDRRRRRDAGRRPRARRAARAVRGAPVRRGLLGDRGRHRHLARSPGRCRGGQPGRSTVAGAGHAPAALDRARPGHLVPVGPDVARLPGDVDASPDLGDRRLHVRVHRRPGPVPDGPRHRGAAVHGPARPDRQPDPGPRDLPAGGGGPGRARSRADHRVAAAARSGRPARLRPGARRRRPSPWSCRSRRSSASPSRPPPRSCATSSARPDPSPARCLPPTRSGRSSAAS